METSLYYYWKVASRFVRVFHENFICFSLAMLKIIYFFQKRHKKADDCLPSTINNFLIDKKKNSRRIDSNSLSIFRFSVFRFFNLSENYVRKTKLSFIFGFITVIFCLQFFSSADCLARRALTLSYNASIIISVFRLTL